MKMNEKRNPGFIVRLLMLLMICCSAAAGAMAQTVVSGKITDKSTSDPLPGATVSITPNGGKTRLGVSDMDGKYRIDNLAAGQYRIKVSYMGYKTYEKSVSLGSSDNKVMNISLTEDATMLENLSVEGRATRAQQAGDTLSYNASAFKVLDGSTAEELLAKMPGIVVEGGEVQAQGESVSKVMVDGKEFFDGDVNLALKNLPADIIASIEVFDKKSDQAEFTGFDDGEEIKTINIVTKSGYKEGVFGKVYGGYGTDNRYNAGGNINIFDESQRLSILGMSNNVNQQNFSQEDLSGVMSAQSSKRGGRRGGGRRGSTDNFMVGSLGGVTKTNGIGLNYVNEWNDKLKLTSSYFFNQSSNDYQEKLQREYFESALPGMSYMQDSESDMTNWNHRVNMNLEYKIDADNTLQLRPKFSYQSSNTLSSYLGENLLYGEQQSSIGSSSESDVKSYSAGLNATYRHRFNKQGRTLSLSVNGQITDKRSDTYTDYKESKTEDGTTTATEYSQRKDNDEKQTSLRTNLMYTEPIVDNVQLSANYKFSYSNSDADKKTFESDGMTDLGEQLIDQMSSVYQTDYLTHAAGLGLRWNLDRWRFTLGADFQWASLDGEQSYPVADNISHNYFSVLPSAMIRYSLNRNNSFMLRYRSSSTSPTLQQLQSVVDNTNPLFLSTGNPLLDQQINHTLNLRYTLTTMSGQTFIAMLGATLRNGYVADSTFVATEDITLPGGIEMDKGAQLTRPVNLDGYYSLQAMLTYGFPLDLIRSNVNLSLAGNYASVPTIFNGVKSNTRELTFVPKVVIGSNISDKLDFTLSYSASTNKALSSVADLNTSNYVTHIAQARVGWTFWAGLTLRSTLTYTGYSGLSADTEDYFLWNASLGKKFLKNNAAEIRLDVYDILGQSQSFRQSVGSNYYDYLTANVLQPYAMVSFVYTIR
jgi:hypothetical protein